MSDKMTSVYSGGLMYEYSLEESKWGIVKLDGDNEEVEELKEFGNLAKAMKAYPAPTGSGGAAKESHGVECPPKSKNWEVDPDILPVIPKNALKFMEEGAGKGLGFKGPGSQTNMDSGYSESNSTDASSPEGQSGGGGAGGSGDDDSAAGRTGVSALIVTGGALAVTLAGAMML